MASSPRPLPQALTPWTCNGFRVDTAQWPLVQVWFPQDFDVASYRPLFRYYGQLCSYGDALAWLIDCRDYHPRHFVAEAKKRQDAASVFQEYRPLLEQVTLCEARVIGNPLARAMVTAFDWLTPNKWACNNFSNAGDGHQWLTEQLSRHAALVHPHGGYAPSKARERQSVSV